MNKQDFEIKEFDLGNVKIAFLIGGFLSDNPKEFMDSKVADYVKEKSYTEFIEKHLDMTQVRIIIFGLNDLINQ